MGPRRVHVIDGDGDQLAARRSAAASVVMGATTLIPLGDAINVLVHDGSVVIALAVHALTAVLMLVSVPLLTLGRSVGPARSAGTTPTSTPTQGVSGTEAVSPGR
ncbi:DUF4267 domain-containing protein [Nakamurella aerolata]|uniref:DUF4267 domain-containing protein n=1 Tax=Nakamurella aerolata TaxID=1656892 RepID=A0A849A4Y8_9ACTN|nr:DUF4267 domain-containing protein [Nakamurella aerolata]NNG35127.1 DUF4267 domain-containing protein [Nakamurella aerolata]